MGRPRAVSFLVLVVPFPQLVGDHVEKAFRSHLRCGILAQRLCQGSVAPSSRSDVTMGKQRKAVPSQWVEGMGNLKLLRSAVATGCS